VNDSPSSSPRAPSLLASSRSRRAKCLQKTGMVMSRYPTERESKRGEQARGDEMMEKGKRTREEEKLDEHSRSLRREIGRDQTKLSRGSERKVEVKKKEKRRKMDKHDVRDQRNSTTSSLNRFGSIGGIEHGHIFVEKHESTSKTEKDVTGVREMRDTRQVKRLLTQGDEGGNGL